MPSWNKDLVRRTDLLSTMRRNFPPLCCGERVPSSQIKDKRNGAGLANSDLTGKGKARFSE